MPKTRWELTAREQVEHLARAEQLRAMGVDVEIPKLQSPVPDVDFEIGYAPDFHNIIFNSSPSRVVLVTGARIVPRRSGVYIDENIRVSLPWKGPEFDLWYTDGCKPHPYRVVPGLTLDPEDVLNHRLEEGMRLQRGKALTGLLLAVAYEAQLPKEYRHGTRISLRVALIDSLGNELAAEGTVHVVRHMEVKKRANHRKGNLFENRPILSGYSETVADQSRRAYLRSIAGPPVSSRCEPSSRNREPHIWKPAGSARTTSSTPL